MSVRIIDIALKAGVSPATVSLVLNNKSGVGQETRNRILGIAKDLDYQGPMTRQTISSSSSSISFLHIARHGHIVNRDHDVFISDYIEGMSQEAKDKNISLKISTYKSISIDEIIESNRESDVMGFVILGTELSAKDVEAFSIIEKPLVFIDNFYKYLNFDFVDMNNEDSVEKIIQCLIRNGHSQIGMVTSTLKTPNFKLREDSFKSSLNYHNLNFQKNFVYTVDSTFLGAYEGMKEFLDRVDDFPTALFCINDIIACGCLKALTEKGIKVPEDISLIGYDNLPISSMSTPGLTSIDVCKIKMGRMAVQLLSDRIQSRSNDSPAKVLIGGKLIERNSVKNITKIKG